MEEKKSRFRVLASETSTGRQRRGVYLLPNLITTGALFGGFFAIVAAVDGKFSAAAIAVFVAMVLDALDGRVARLTKTESSFGKQFDSLSDMVAFGVAPALIVFEWGLQSLTQFGWLATFVYMACAALRLARFNLSGDSRFFTGLPSPMAACVLASGVWLCTDLGVQTPSMLVSVLAAIIVIGIGILMVANIRYFSPKSFEGTWTSSIRGIGSYHNRACSRICKSSGRTLRAWLVICAKRTCRNALAHVEGSIYYRR